MGRDVKLIFEQFVLEDDCSFDFVRVELANGTIFGKFCSNDLPPDQFSEGPMKITFESDGDNEFPGFKASYLVKGKRDLVFNAPMSVKPEEGGVGGRGWRGEVGHMWGI